MDEKSLIAALPGVSALRFYQKTGSTNDDALAWIAQGAPDFSIIVAEHQTAGRGRMQRRWITPSGAALAFSLILRPQPEETSRLSFFSALGAVALGDILSQDYGLESEIKWPNDLLLARRKTAGILAEAAWQGRKPFAVVIGIGVNVAPESVPGEETLSFPATCIEQHVGSKIDRLELLARLVDRMRLLRPSTGSPAFIQTWRERLAFQGQAVSVEQAGETPIRGTMDGLDEDGSLLVRTETGTIYRIQAGDVRLRPIEAANFNRGGSPC